jgi:hypothetical protein
MLTPAADAKSIVTAPTKASKKHYGQGKHHENELNIQRLEKFFEEDKLQNEHESWRKIEKEVRHKKLVQYAGKYVEENNLSEKDHQGLITFFKECVENNKIQKVRDVDYDKKLGEIKHVHGLQYNSDERRFTIKHYDKRLSTTQNLPQKCLESLSTSL